jgi:hypothetical protein
VNPIVDLFFELVFVDEAVDLQGAEEVADAFADTASARDPTADELGDCRLSHCILL